MSQTMAKTITKGAAAMKKRREDTSGGTVPTLAQKKAARSVSQLPKIEEVQNLDDLTKADLRYILNTYIGGLEEKQIYLGDEKEKMIRNMSYKQFEEFTRLQRKALQQHPKKPRV